MSDAKPIRMAATIMLLRETPSLEVLMVRRNQMIDFFSGAMVFPGGKLTEEDASPAWADHALGWHDVPEDERAPRIAAVRETFEETGMLLAEGGRSGTAEERHAVEHGEIPFLDYVREKGVTPDLGGLTRFARWLAPSSAPKRFDTFFYIAKAPEDQEPVHDGRETVMTEWIAPSEALRLWETRERAIVFPTRMNLRALLGSETLAAAALAASVREGRTVHPQVVEVEGVRRLRLALEDGYGEVDEVFDR
ncbi:NUDIX domain-containing protein [Albimonas donghaensis]|uniref:NUDIX domain-containing protein n=1 Tax=Albimonas donghaensis TaxID=356660 RepID=A0A1H2Y6Y6_9RHOB|nr:NUDIX domain-containing protein [Albimonas donghaensis]SDX00820.1 NUDIX domain-containing protein [Albimonas donghaensis]